MRFIQSMFAAMVLIGTVSAVPIPYQFDVTGDNTFQVYVSRAGTATSQVLLAHSSISVANGGGQAIQFGWSTPTRYLLSLDTGDVLSIYVHNLNADSNASGTTIVGGNPSGIVGRLRELKTVNSVPGDFRNDGKEVDIATDQKWECAHRIELTNTATWTDFNPSRLTGNAADWAGATFTGASMPLLGGGAPFVAKQKGDVTFVGATQVAALHDPTSKWANTNVDGQIGTNAIVAGIPASTSSTPYWIYASNQLHGDSLSNHGWCRLAIPEPPGRATLKPTPTPGAGGDPVFNGFQGQEFQFHGLPDEHFNLISSPQVQLNAHFVYLSAGTCDYNNTQCWTHPGTYMDVLGFSIGEARIKLVAGTHADGLRLWVNDAEVPRHTTIGALSGNVTASLHYSRSGHVKIATDLIDYEIVNSDMFMNLQAALKSSELLSTGAHAHTVTDSRICHSNAETHNHQLIESTVSKKYPITTALHGLVGQTWRNVKVCSRDWMGTVQDYVTESLFGTTYHYNYFKF